MLKYQPDVVILNTGWAHIKKYGPIIMGKEDVLKTHLFLPKAQIVATHMEAINHCILSRQELQSYVNLNEIQTHVHIPKDEETLTF